MRRINRNPLRKRQAFAGIVVLFAALIAVTPLCGALFQCGCDWPWSGLDSGCNYFKPSARHRCPWCVSLAGGILSTGSAIAAGIGVSVLLPSVLRRPLTDVMLRIVVGLASFAVIALSAAAIAALLQAYPLGIGSYLR